MQLLALTPPPGTEPGSGRREAVVVAVAAVASLALLATGAVLVGPAVVVPVLGLAGIGAVVWRSSRDLGTVIAGILLTVLLFPTWLRVPGIGALGSAANLAGLAALALWAWGSLRVPGRWPAGRQPVRIVAALFVGSVLASYIAAHLRVIDIEELRAADRGGFTAVAAAGIALLVADGIRSRQQLRAVVQALVAGGAVLATLGVVHFMTGVNIAAAVRIPGLTAVIAEYTDERSGFQRIAATTAHPIEFSVVLAMLLPLALHLAWWSSPGARWRWRLCAVVICIALPMTVSRTSVVAIVVAMLVLLPTWSRARRRVAIIAGLVLVMAMRAAVPGLLGTIKSLFLWAGSDDSVTARRADYAYITQFVEANPMFGRGFQTFLPRRYAFIDNQYILSIVETGIIGLAAVLAFLGVGVALAVAARRATVDAETRDIAQAVIAGIAVTLASSAVYDSLSFPVGRMLVFAFVGLAGALWRLSREPSGQQSAVPVASAPLPATTLPG